MENEIVLKVEGLEIEGAKEKILRRAEKMPGIEHLSIDEDAGTVTVIGGDLDRLGLEDEIEGLGYQIVR
ncbi:MAG: heavy-metal-associated domain-containing protein [Oscillospiraceae bacterium]|nr:heavy-metal-associated domain-containing protein [Oscillospiraceae bacterium]